MGDLGGYGIAELPPAGPLFALGPYRALGQKGNPWEVVRNSISAQVTHAEISFISLISFEEKMAKNFGLVRQKFLCRLVCKRFRTGFDLYFLKKIFGR